MRMRRRWLEGDTKGHKVGTKLSPEMRAGYMAWARDLNTSRSYLLLLAVDAYLVAADEGFCDDAVTVNYVAWEDACATICRGRERVRAAQALATELARTTRGGKAPDDGSLERLAAELEQGRDELVEGVRLLREIARHALVRDHDLRVSSRHLNGQPRERERWSDYMSDAV